MTLISTAKAFKRMVILAWRAHPYCFLGLILIDILQGFIPLALAWITKLLFDLLAKGLQGQVFFGRKQLFYYFFKPGWRY